jgi:hypothetical protein
MIPPPLKLPPHTATMDEFPPLRRIRFRLWQIGLAGITVFVTAWCFSLGPFAGILAAVVAKHILVAILASGLTLPDDERERGA